jgi:hypothetical protein
MSRGVIVHDLTGRTFNCTVLDVSLGGARLQLFAPDLPDGDITLIDRESESPQRLRVVWRAGPMIGVAFVGATTTPEPGS